MKTAFLKETHKLEFVDKRSFTRTKVNCAIEFKLIDSIEFYKGRCTSLSGANLSFIAEQNCELGKSMEINIIPENSMMPPMTAFIETVRHAKLESGQFEIAALIQSIKSTE